jgi:hypothetical protein
MRPLLPVGVDPAVSRTLPNFAVSRGAPLRSPIRRHPRSLSRLHRTLGPVLKGGLAAFNCFLV